MTAYSSRCVQERARWSDSRAASVREGLPPVAGWLEAALFVLVAALVPGCGVPPPEQDRSRQQASGGGSAHLELQKAIDAHDWPSVKQALDNGANANAVLPPEQPVLTRAVIEGDVSVVRLLLAAGAAPNGDPRLGTDPPLFTASLEGVNPDVISELVRAGADPNARSGGMTPLGMAAFSGNGPACQALVTGGANVDDWNQWPPAGRSVASTRKSAGKGRTALMIGAARGHYGVVFVLLQLGAKPGTKTRMGEQPSTSSANLNPRARQSESC